MLSHEYTKQIYPKIATINEKPEQKIQDINTNTSSNPLKHIKKKSSLVSVFSDHWFKPMDTTSNNDSQSKTKHKHKSKSKSKSSSNTSIHKAGNNNTGNKSTSSVKISKHSKHHSHTSSSSTSSSSSSSSKHKKGGANVPLPNTLLRIIHQLPLSSFAFLHKNSGIIVPTKAFKCWPSPKGFTFCGWLLWHQFEPFTRSKTSWMCVYSMLTVSGYGIDISLCNKTGQVKIRITGKNIVDEKVIPSVRLLSSQWYFVGITHVPSRTAALRILRPSHASGTCKIYVNGERVSSVDLSYPPINEPPRYCSGIFIFFFFRLAHLQNNRKQQQTKKQEKEKKRKTILSLHNSAVFCLYGNSFFFGSADRYKKGGCLSALFVLGIDVSLICCFVYCCCLIFFFIVI